MDGRETIRTHPKKGQAGWFMLPVPSSDRRNSLSSYLARRQCAFPLTIDAVDWADVSSCPYLPLCHAPATSGEGRRWWVQALSSLPSSHIQHGEGLRHTRFL